MKDKEQKNTTEDLLRQKLEGFELPVEDSVFDNIQSEINHVPEPAKKKGGGWRLLLGALLALIGIVLIGLFYPFNTTQEQTAEPPVDSAVQEESQPIQNTPESYQVDTKEKSPSGLSRNGELPVNQKIAPAQKDREGGQASRTFKSTVPLQASSPNIVSARVPTGNKGSVAQNTALINNTAPVLKEYEESKEPMAASPSSLKTSVEAEKKRESTQNTASAQPPEKLVANGSPAISNDTLNPNYLPVNKTDFATDVSDRKRFEIMARGGLGFSYRILRIKPDEDLQTHKNQHERSGLTFNYTLGLRYHFHPKMYLSSGLGYASFSERYAFHHDVINHTTVNTYNYLQVPLIAGIQLWQYKNTILYGQLGVVWNSLTTAQSSWVNPHNLEAVSHTNDGSEHPFQKNTFEGLAGFDLAFSLNERWSIHLMPQAGIFLNSVYLQSTQLEQKPYAGSINIGVSRKF